MSMYRQGLKSSDWLEVNSKVKLANIQQLQFLKSVIDDELIKRLGQDY